jgi:hypothetical protein
LNKAAAKNKWLIFWSLIFLAGLIGWIYVLRCEDGVRAWRMFLVNFLYFGSLGAGLVTWSAITIASRGTWMGKLKNTSAGGAGFGILMLAGFIVLCFGEKNWAVWIGKEQIIGGWLNLRFMIIRNLTAFIIFWIVAVIFARNVNKNSRTFSGWLIFLYSVVFSLAAFDLVMPLEMKWVSTLFGGYFFISGLYIAVAGWCFLSIITGAIDDRRQLWDLSTLILTFCMLTTYLMFSHLMVIWYENIPRETSYLVPRMNITEWKIISAVLLVMVYLGPIAMLIWKNLKMNKIYMSIVCLIILTGMWMERWWLVMPSLGEKLKFGFSEASSLLLFIGGFALSYYAGLKLPKQIERT